MSYTHLYLIIAITANNYLGACPQMENSRLEYIYLQAEHAKEIVFDLLNTEEVNPEMLYELLIHLEEISTISDLNY